MPNDSVDFYSVNNDFSGTRTMQSKIQEIVEYHANSAVRIWCNDLATGFDPHWHTAMEIIMPVENWYDVIVRETTFHVVPGDILIIPSGEIHEIKAPETGTRFVFLLDTSYVTSLPGYSAVAPVLSTPVHITRASHPHIYDDVYQSLVRMRNEYFNRNEFAELTIFSLLLGLFVKLGTNQLNNTDLFSNVRLYKQKEYITKFNDVISYINDHYTENFSLEDIAAASGFSKFHFSRLFRQYTGFTFCSYIYHRRIMAAEELLAQPDLSITEIAMQSGFPSISTFNRVFRQQKNCSPTEYREKNHHHTNSLSHI